MNLVISMVALEAVMSDLKPLGFAGELFSHESV